MSLQSAARTAARLTTAVALSLATLAGTAAVTAPAASAEETTTIEAFTECNGGYGSGSGWDDAGRTYLACGSTIRVYTATGAFERSISVPFTADDVAPSPNGAHLYVARGSASPARLDRQGDGSYAVSGWAPQSYSLYGTTYAPKGRWLATDAAGNLYVADGAWTSNSTHTVLKYAPDGRLITRFGEWANSWNTGTFYWQLNGLSVSRDGSQVVTVEGGNDRLQRWGRQADGSYAVTSVFGSNAANHGDRQGDNCNFNGWTGEFASAYDTGFDGAGNFYVLNTTCVEVNKFSPTGAFLKSFDLRHAGASLPHGFAVARNGDVFVPQAQRRIRTSNVVVDPEPTGDTQAPAITRAPAGSLGARTSTTRVPVVFRWAGNDDTGIVKYEVRMRINGGADTAMKLKTATSTNVTRWIEPGRRYELSVRALDAAGNASPWRYSAPVVLDALQESSPALQFTAGWAQAYSPELFGEGLKAASTAGAGVSVTFTGRQIAWIGPRNAGRGASKVYLDGVHVDTVDQYSSSSTSQHRLRLWTKTFATSGTHTLKIVAVGTPDRPRVDVDALVVMR